MLNNHKIIVEPPATIAAIKSHFEIHEWIVPMMVLNNHKI